jgi:hypothetical protein
MPGLGFVPSEPRPIEGPACPTCTMQMGLLHVEPHKLGFDLRTFECQECKHSECVIVKNE